MKASVLVQISMVYPMSASTCMKQTLVMVLFCLGLDHDKCLSLAVKKGSLQQHGQNITFKVELYTIGLI